jgi:tRNA (guanine-N7-)-methyltransferase
MRIFLPSFKGQRTRGLKSDNKKFLKDEFLVNHSINIENLKEVSSFSSVVIEIGSGNGETASKFAKDNPETLYISCEVFIDVMIQGCQKAFDNKLSNIRFFTKDARELLVKLPWQSIDSIFLFFPDPWPKKRHHKRRIFTLEFLTLASLALKTKGQILISTDHDGYKEHIKEVASSQELFDFSESLSPSFWTETKYQKKALKEGRCVKFFLLEKK